MSETTNKIPLNRITVPAITDANYAAGLDSALQNINNNFSILSNRDFVKGEHGASIVILEDNFFNEDGQITILGNKLKSCIEAHTPNEQERANITYGDITLTLWDNFTPESAGSLYMIYKTENDDALPEPISSLYYIFLDGRFANDKVGLIDPSEYTNVKDLSCILVYDKGEFKILDNAFPTIYYERGVGLCWKINGNGTGLPVQGIPGKDGVSATLNIVKCGVVESNNAIISGEVDSIFSIYDGYKPVASVENINDYNGAAALILTPDVEVDEDGNSTILNSSKFYFGYTNIVETTDENGNIVKTLYAMCDSETPISYGVKVNEIVNAMKEMKLVGAGQDVSTGLRGLFIPIKDVDGLTGKQPVHLLSATAIANTDNNVNGDNTDVVFTPVEDINTLNVSDADNNSLKVDKYLYLKLNTNNSNIFAGPNVGKDSGKINVDELAAHNYTLKYKLTTIIKSVTSPSFDILNENTNDIVGSRVFGYVNKPGTTEVVLLNTDNTVYYNTLEYGVSTDINKRYLFDTNHIHTLPEAFANRLNGFSTSDYGTDEPLGIYRWELCSDKHDFDVDELIDFANESGKYSFPNQFAVIYTDTINPSIDTDFIWFNGLELIDADYYKDNNDIDNIDGYIKNANVQGIDGVDVSGKYVIAGWNRGNNESIFSFVKFVPVYDNDFAAKEDTALNLNYNVNITGDTNNPNRNITIHGSVNCDELSVYKLTATGEIKDIFTQDTIIGTRGIKLALNDESVNSDDYKFTIDDSGNVKAYKVEADNMTAEDIAGNTITSVQSISNEIFINKKNNNNARNLFAGHGFTNNEFGIELTDVQNIKIKKKKNGTDLFGKEGVQPYAINDLPIINNNNATLVVSNQPDDTTEIGYYGVNTGTNLGSGVNGWDSTPSSKPTAVISKPKFEYIKNFNISKIANSGGTNRYIEGRIQGGTPPKSYTYGESILKNVIATTADSGKQQNYELNLSTSFFKDNFDTQQHNAIQYFKIQKTSDEKTGNIVTSTYEFDKSSNIEIVFDNTVDYVFAIGIMGQNSNGRWPVLRDTSKLELQLWCKITDYKNSKNNDLFLVTGKTQNLNTIQYTTNSIKNDSGYEWRGYNDKGDQPDGEWHWRYKEFRFRPKKFVISSNLSENSEYLKIVNAYNNGASIDFYVYPKFTLKASGQTLLNVQKKVVKGVRATVPIPVSADTGVNVKDNDKVYIGGLLQNGKYKGQPKTKNWTGYKDSFVDAAATLNYNEIVSKTEASNINVTSICEDGIVIRSGNSTFGLGTIEKVFDHKELGYINSVTNVNDKGSWGSGQTAKYIDNVPALFYYKSYDTANNGLKGKENSVETFARYVDAIPLEDIFNSIKLLRQRDTNAWSNFGL